MARLMRSVMLVVAAAVAMSCGTPEWPRLWSAYQSTFLDGQIRVIDRDSGDRTTSDGQAFAMFFTLVANDRARFDKLLRWTEVNLAAGDLSAHLPAWLWGRSSDDRWTVIDPTPRSNADVWLAYTLFEAGRAWSEPRYTRLADALATRIAQEEVMQLEGFGPVLLPRPHRHDSHGSRRIYGGDLPLQIFYALADYQRDGPWRAIALSIPAVVRASAPQGLAMDSITISEDGRITPASHGGTNAMRMYLWAGMLNRSTSGHDAILTALSGVTRASRGEQTLLAKLTTSAEKTETHDARPGFSAAVLPYLEAVGETRLAREELARLRSSRDDTTGLIGRPPRYADQTLALFAIGAHEQQFWFDARGRLRTTWMTR
jgi:endo-1,4-beta-D-glucanase Y